MNAPRTIPRCALFAPQRHMLRSLALVLLAMQLAGCHHYVTPEGTSPQAYLLAQQPAKVRVTLGDGTRHVLVQVSAVRDSLRGTVFESEYAERLPGDPWMLPFAGLERFEVRTADDPATFGLVTGTVILVGALAVGTVAILVLTSME